MSVFPHWVWLGVGWCVLAVSGAVYVWGLYRVEKVAEPVVVAPSIQEVLGQTGLPLEVSGNVIALVTDDVEGVLFRLQRDSLSVRLCRIQVEGSQYRITLEEGK